MKIKCDLSKNYFKIYNEAKTASRNKKSILKSHKIPNISYGMEIILLSTLLLFLSLMFFLNKYLVIGIVLLTIDISYVLYLILKYLIIYNIRYKVNFENTIIFDEEGLTYSAFYDIKMTFKWSKIKAIVIQKHSLTILTDTPIYFYLNKECLEKVLKVVDEYAPKTLVLEAS